MAVAGGAAVGTGGVDFVSTSSVEDNILSFRSKSSTDPTLRDVGGGGAVAKAGGAGCSLASSVGLLIIMVASLFKKQKYGLFVGIVRLLLLGGLLLSSSSFRRCFALFFRPDLSRSV